MNELKKFSIEDWRRFTTKVGLKSFKRKVSEQN